MSVVNSLSWLGSKLARSRRSHFFSLEVLLEEKSNASRLSSCSSKLLQTPLAPSLLHAVAALQSGRVTTNTTIYNTCTLQPVIHEHWRAELAAAKRAALTLGCLRLLRASGAMPCCPHIHTRSLTNTLSQTHVHIQAHTQRHTVGVRAHTRLCCIRARMLVLANTHAHTCIHRHTYIHIYEDVQTLIRSSLSRIHILASTYSTPPRNRNRANTVLHRGMETPLMETILRFASVSLRKMETDLLGSWWP